MMMRVARVYFLFGIFLHVCYSGKDRYSDWSWEHKYESAISICDDKIQKIVSESISQLKCLEYQIKRQINRKCKGDRITLETNLMDYPHMAAVGTKSKKGKFLLHCAGALISPNFVLSAYNCYIKPNQNIIHVSPTIVKLGTADIREEYKTAMTVIIKQIIRHPMQKGDYNNLALVKLNQAVEFSKFIQPACLSTNETMDHRPMSTTGWYFYNDIQKHNTKLSHVLQHTDIIKEYSNQNLYKRMFFTNKIYINGVASYPIRTGGTIQLHFSSSENEKSYYTLLAVLSQPGPNNKSIYHTVVKRNVLYTAIEPYINWIEHTVWPEYTPSYTSD